MKHQVAAGDGNKDQGGVLSSHPSWGLPRSLQQTTEMIRFSKGILAFQGTDSYRQFSATDPPHFTASPQNHPLCKSTNSLFHIWKPEKKNDQGLHFAQHKPFQSLPSCSFPA